MNETLQLIAILGTIIGLAVWLTKRSTVRAEKITDAHINSLTQINERQADFMTTVTKSIDANTEAVKGVGETAKALTAEVGKWSCRAPQTVSRKRKTT